MGMGRSIWQRLVEWSAIQASFLQFLFFSPELLPSLQWLWRSTDGSTVESALFLQDFTTLFLHLVYTGAVNQSVTVNRWQAPSMWRSLLRAPLATAGFTISTENQNGNSMGYGGKFRCRGPAVLSIPYRTL